MVIAVLADDTIKEEFLAKGIPEGINIIWPDSLRSLLIVEADVYFDLVFEYDSNRIAGLKKLLPAPVVVNSVAYTLKDLNAPFIRVNAWPTMLQRDVVEVAGHAESEPAIQDIFGALHWKYQRVPDVTGMVTPRIISMIVNEAWYTFGEDISSKEEIDTAMKLGTNYPFGPFEWSERIGSKNVVQLLNELQRTDNRYTIAPALLNEIKRNGTDS
jgi:3-hydroxybutyryl-CoA dehydrogenase